MNEGHSQPMMIAAGIEKKVSFSANILLQQILSLLEINHFSQPKIS